MTLTRRDLVTAAGALAGGSLVPPVLRAQPRAPALTLACANYVRYLPIATGDVRPVDVDLTWVRGDRNEMLRRATDDASIDGGESSMAQHVMRLDRGDRSLVAIPVFPLRNFTARDLYTRKGHPLDVKTLDGRRIGIYNWGASGAVWYRHLVRHFGNDVTRILWVVGGVDGAANVTVPDPPPAHVTKAPAGQSLADLLVAGAIDAFFGPLPPRRHHPVDGPIVRALPDFKSVEQDYFARTRCYPPQHVILLRRASWERDTAAARRLVGAFNESERVFEALQRQYPYNSPWLIDEVEEAARVMGPDYHAHGFERNRHAVDTFCATAFEDGLTKRRVTADEFFADYLA